MDERVAQYCSLYSWLFSTTVRYLLPLFISLFFLQEKFIRQTLREFPYLESESLQGMIHTLSKTQMGHKPTALEVLNTSINGPALPNQDDRICETCGSVGAEKR